MTGQPSGTTRAPKLSTGGLSTGLAMALDTGLRAFFCACLLLLPLYPVAEQREPRSAGVGMEASPPPLLEASSRLAAGGGLERRSGLPVTPGSWRTVLGVWDHAPEPAPALPDLARVPRAAFGRWQLEGG